MEVKQAIKPAYKITYAGKDVTADLAPYLLELTYTDRLNGQSDELDITLMDNIGRWLDNWYPEKGAEIKLEYGYAHKPLVSAGSFDVDEIEISGLPTTVRIRALSTGLGRQVRTRIGKAYEKTTLKAIVDKVAKRIKATVKGTIAAIDIPKATQYQETEWAFLVRICREYGYVIKLTDNNKTLVVAKLTDLASQKAVRVITPQDITSFTYRDKITEVPSKTEVKHHDPDKKAIVSAEVKSGRLTQDKSAASDTRKRIVAAKTPAQAKAIAEAEQERHEADKTNFSFVLPGDPTLVAGAAIDVAKFFKLSGTYVLTESKHTISRSGYITEPQCKRLKEAA